MPLWFKFSDSEHFPMYPLAICISPLEKYLFQVLARILTGIAIFRCRVLELLSLFDASPSTGRDLRAPPPGQPCRARVIEHVPRLAVTPLNTSTSCKTFESFLFTGDCEQSSSKYPRTGFCENINFLSSRVST